MKSTMIGLVCGLALVAGAASASPALPQSATVKTSDLTLIEQIEARVHQDAALKKHDVKVTVDAGVATLTGTVENSDQKSRAAQLARVKGVTRVDNRLVVDRTAGDAVAVGTKGTLAESKEAAKEAGGSAREAAKEAGEAAKAAGTAVKEVTKEAGEKAKDGAVNIGEKTVDGVVTAAEKTKEGAVVVGEKTRDGAVVVGEKTKEGVSKVSSELSDAFILTKVKSQFVGEDVLKGSDINVDCDQRIVRLRGTVPTAAARARAMEIARRTDGVQRVIDDLTIAPKQ